MCTLIVACPTPVVKARGLASGTYREAAEGLEKRCTRCQDYWPADSEFFYANRGKSDGLGGTCKACYLENRYPDGRRQPQPQKGTTTMPTSNQNHVPATSGDWADRISAALEEKRTPDVADLKAGFDALMAENEVLQDFVVDATELLGRLVAARYKKDNAAVLTTLDAFMATRAAVRAEGA